jgi:hypothetical protein
MAQAPLGDVLEASERALRPPDTGPTRRGAVGAKPATLRRDAWWLQPMATGVVLLAFVGYATWVAFQGKHFFAPPNYLSPFYSPCLASGCGAHTNLAIFGKWYQWSPALIILIFPLGFRLTCYYYRKTYYRTFWFSPPACAVAEPHGRYTGETRFPLVLQNVHRYFFYFTLLFAAILTWDAVDAFHWPQGWGHMGLGTLMLVVNAGLIWGYQLSCHSCRHLCGGKLNKFSNARVRYRLWRAVSRLNANHAKWAWASLVWIALTDAYIRMVSMGWIGDPKFF